MLDKKCFVAVYGSLRQGMSNHTFLKNSKLIKKTTLDRKFIMVDLGSFPALMKYDKSNLRIVVEIYEISEKILKDLDKLESCPKFYNREIVRIDIYDCWIYYIEPDNRFIYGNANIVRSGDWVQYYLFKFNKKKDIIPEEDDDNKEKTKSKVQYYDKEKLKEKKQLEKEVRKNDDES
jgi:gamma-glutamylcyclotransferase (GGCT)/AIG2-like uncharacterized protein YtfP